MAFVVQCEGCGASFQLPDSLYERKVKGRIVTIRCKHCAAEVHLDGTKLEAPAAGDEPTAPAAQGEAAADADEAWAVSFASDDDRELSTSEIARALKKGEINGETIVWREGMDAWQPIAKVSELAALLPAAREEEPAEDGWEGEPPEGATPASPEAKAEQRAVLDPSTEASVAGVFDAPPASLRTGAEPEPEENKKGQPGWWKKRKAPAPPGRAKKQAEPDKQLEPEGDVDIDIDFQSLSAPLDLDVPSLSELAKPMKAEAPKEEGVSVGKWILQPPLAALTTAGEKATGKPRGAVSDVASSLVSPLEPVRARPGERNWAVLGLILLGAAALMAGTWFVARATEDETSASEQLAAAEMTQSPPASAGAIRQSGRRAEGKRKSTASAAAESQPAAAAEAKDGKPGGRPKQTGERKGTKAEPGKSGEAVAKATEKEAKPKKEKKKEEAASDAPFNRSAAISALTTAAANASACRRGGDPSGVATVIVTFTNSGRAINANVSGPPFAGTATGGCIASTMRRARVPPFGGNRVTVSKRVVIR